LLYYNLNSNMTLTQGPNGECYSGAPL